MFCCCQTVFFCLPRNLLQSTSASSRFVCLNFCTVNIFCAFGQNIATYLFFSHCMECVIPNDTSTKTVLCVARTRQLAAVASIDLTIYCCCCQHKKTPFILFCTLFFSPFRFYLSLLLLFLVFRSIRVVSLQKFTAIRSLTDTHFHDTGVCVHFYYMYILDGQNEREREKKK